MPRPRLSACNWRGRPPESLQGRPYGLSFDWYSFGVTAFELLCGELPRAPLSFAPALGDCAPSLVRTLLDPDVAARLGADGDGTNVLAHAWFAAIDWEALDARTVKPPFLPDPRRANFDAHQARAPPAAPPRSSCAPPPVIPARSPPRMTSSLPSTPRRRRRARPSPPTPPRTAA